MAQAIWDKPNGNEWLYVGDGVKYDENHLQPLADAWFTNERLVVSVDRALAFEVERPSLTATLNTATGVHGGAFGRVLISDHEMKRIAELKDMGVARFGWVNTVSNDIEKSS